MQNHLIVASVCLLVGLSGCQSSPHTTSPFYLPPFSSNGMFSNQSNNLSQSVQEALMNSDELAVSRIQVETVQNTVILKGYVKKIRQSDIAEQIARQVPGVQGVENNIVVRP